MTWTSKHQDFAAKNNWWQSAINVANYLYRRQRTNEPMVLEFDSDKFNTRMKSVRGRKYHRTTIPKAVKHLAERSQGLIIIERDYGKGVFKLRVFPLSFLNENGGCLNDSSHAAAADSPTRGKGFGRVKKKCFKQQQKCIDQINNLLTEVGLKFDQDALNNIYRLSGKSVERVIKAVELLLYRNSNRKIPKPHGFIIDCLRKRWCDGFDIYYEPDLPAFENKVELRNFIDNLQSAINYTPGRIRQGKKNGTPQAV